MMETAWAGLRLAVGTLTMIPVGSLPPTTRRIGAWAMALAPIAALPLGLLIFLYAFELLVAILRAYIFTILAAVYIDAAMHPQH